MTLDEVGSPFQFLVMAWVAGFAAAGVFHFLAYAWSGGEWSDSWGSSD